LCYFCSVNGNKSIVSIVCGAAFLLFTFCWLYFFQGDMLAVAQHGLSGGKTHYDLTIGAVIITSVLFVLQLAAAMLTRLARHHWLTYVPSFLLLSFVSSVSSPFSWGAWPWAGPLVLVLWVVAVVVVRKLYSAASGWLSAGVWRDLWQNLLPMAAMMLFVAGMSDTNAVRHFRAHAELSLMRGDADEVLRTGDRSLETDESLTMLRLFALSRQGVLGDSLFTYAVTGTSLDMLPLAGSQGRLMLMPDTLLWDHFGVRPDTIVLRSDSALRVQWAADTLRPAYAGVSPFASRFTVRQYLDSLEHDSMATTAVRDYRLAGHLIDRRLDSFAVALPRYYPLSADSLPRHYREALVLYQQRFDTLFIYKDSLMLECWKAFEAYDSLYAKKSERLIRMENQQKRTYWYYYYK